MTLGKLRNQPENTNLLLPQSFIMTLKRCPTISYFCTEVNLPGLDFGRIDIPTKFANYKVPGSSTNFEDITISFQIDENMRNWYEIFKWMQEIHNVEDFERYKSAQKLNESLYTKTPHWFSDVNLSILTSKKNINLEFAFKNCFPTSLSPLQFSLNTTEADPMICTVTLAYTTYDLMNTEPNYS